LSILECREAALGSDRKCPVAARVQREYMKYEIEHSIHGLGGQKIKGTTILSVL